MSITAAEMTQRSIASRRDKKAIVAQEARDLYQQGMEVPEIAKYLGEKHKRNKKPYSIYTIYEYLGGTKALKESR